jgi:hypothetical protein
MIKNEMESIFNKFMNLKKKINETNIILHEEIELQDFTPLNSIHEMNKTQQNMNKYMTNDEINNKRIHKFFKLVNTHFDNEIISKNHQFINEDEDEDNVVFNNNSNPFGFSVFGNNSKIDWSFNKNKNEDWKI